MPANSPILPSNMIFPLVVSINFNAVINYLLLDFVSQFFFNKCTLFSFAKLMYKEKPFLLALCLVVHPRSNWSFAKLVFSSQV